MKNMEVLKNSKNLAINLRNYFSNKAFRDLASTRWRGPPRPPPRSLGKTCPTCPHPACNAPDVETPE